MRSQIKYAAYLLLGLLGFKSMPAQAAVDMFLCIDNIPGEAQSKVHPDCIDVLAWSWGVSNSSSAGGGTGQTNVQDISVTKYLDRSSPLLTTLVTNSKTLGNMVLYVEHGCDSCGDLNYYRLNFAPGSVVTSLSTGGSGGEDKLTENVTFNFENVEWCYTYKQVDLPSTEICGDYDIAAP